MKITDPGAEQISSSFTTCLCYTYLTRYSKWQKWVTCEDKKLPNGCTYLLKCWISPCLHHTSQNTNMTNRAMVTISSHLMAKPMTSFTTSMTSYSKWYAMWLQHQVIHFNPGSNWVQVRINHAVWRGHQAPNNQGDTMDGSPWPHHHYQLTTQSAIFKSLQNLAVKTLFLRGSNSSGQGSTSGQIWPWQPAKLWKKWLRMTKKLPHVVTQTWNGLHQDVYLILEGLELRLCGIGHIQHLHRTVSYRKYLQTGSAGGM